MEPTSSIMTVIGSGLLAAIVSASVARLNAERTILIDNITKERKNWREKIREKSTKVSDAYYEKKTTDLKKLKLEFLLLLNPHEPDDKEIIEHFIELIERCEQGDDSVIDDFTIKLSLLLKHDWERAKIEANPLENIGRSADRTSFKKYRESSREASSE